jgi:hypothetical protein
MLGKAVKKRKDLNKEHPFYTQQVILYIQYCIVVIAN